MAGASGDASQQETASSAAGSARLGVCFDATGTLLELTEPVGETYHRIALDFGIDLPAWRLQDAFVRVLARAPERGLEGDTVAARQDGERAWWTEVIRQTFQATDSTARFDDFPSFSAALFETFRASDRWRLRAEVAQGLALLAASGIRSCVVSNFDHRLEEILEALGINHEFVATLIPSTPGLEKPARGLFETASKSLGLPIERLVYVGDDPPERLAAISAHGLQVFPVDAETSFLQITKRILSAATLGADSSSPGAAHRDE